MLGRTAFVPDFDRVASLVRLAISGGGGERLGPLGSHIVASTLLGLIIKDPDSYWNAGNGPWSPARFDADHPINSIEDMVRFCGMV